MMFPSLPAMWPGLPEPPKLRSICKKCKRPTDLQYLVDGVCGPCRIENMSMLTRRYPDTTITGTGTPTRPATGTATDTGTGPATRYYYSTGTTSSGTGGY